MTRTVGILAYGDPDWEIARARVRTTAGVRTPFAVEFARRSRSRGGAPTLVPVAGGGSPVVGQVFVLDVPEIEAASLLWRRETRQVGSGRAYRPPATVGPDTVVVRRIENFAEIDVVLYTEITANIEPLTASTLARLAIESVCRSDRGLDGISYLMATKRNGITTPPTADYEAEILRQSGCADLKEALARLQEMARRRQQQP